MGLSVVYVTVPTEKEGEHIAKTIVAERLAACGNVQSPITSFYWWNGSLQKEREISVLLKTRSELVEAVIARVRALHTYDCPCIVSYSIDAAFAPYEEWVKKETESAS